MSRALMAASLALSLVLASSEGIAQVACPESEISLSGAVANVTVAIYDSTAFANHLHFDLVGGALSLAYCCSLLPTYEVARDAYDVIGVPAGTPVAVTVRLTVDSHVYDAGLCGGTGCSGTFRASIRSGVDYAEATHSPILFAGAEAFYHDVIELPLTIVAGTPRVIGFEFWARRALGGSHGADGTGTIRFVGLGSGTAVISCEGFASGATPTRRSTWGLLKTVYR